MARCAKVKAWTEYHRVAGTPTADAIGAAAQVSDGGHFPVSTSLLIEGSAWLSRNTVIAVMESFDDE